MVVAQSHLETPATCWSHSSLLENVWRIFIFHRIDPFVRHCQSHLSEERSFGAYFFKPLENDFRLFLIHSHHRHLPLSFFCVEVCLHNLLEMTHIAYVVLKAPHPMQFVQPQLGMVRQAVCYKLYEPAPHVEQRRIIPRSRQHLGLARITVTFFILFLGQILG